MLTRPIVWPLLGSLAAHAAVLLWIRLTEDPPPPPRAHPDDDAVELTTVEFDLLEPEPIPAEASRATRTESKEPEQSAGEHRQPRILSEAPPGGRTEPKDVTAPPTGGERGDPPRSPIAPPSPAELARRLAPELGPPPPRSPLAPPRSNRPPRAPASEIRPDGKGAYRSDDLTFNAKVARDGTVTFEDLSDFSIHVSLPGPRTIGRHLDAWRRDPYGVSVGGRESSELDTKTDAATQPGGLADEMDEARKRTVPIVGGRFNFDDAIAKRGGFDPYIARKMAYMDRTRDERTRMASVDRDDRLREAVTKLRAHLARVWSYQPWTPAQRRDALFVLWDECAERGAANVVAAAATARATIEAFIRAELPAGSEHAFTAAELVRMNRGRQSHQPFAPYR